MRWTQSQCIGLSAADCNYCHGNGTRQIDPRRRVNEVPCNCVFRGAFRACLMKYRQCVAEQGRIGIVKLERRVATNKNAVSIYGFSRAEFSADFDLIARRFLDQPDYDVFRIHFLHGGDWRSCAAALKIDRGQCFHAIYRIQQILGRAFAEIEPYGLWPLDEYFGGVVTRTAPRSLAA